ncbi:hypothetical protein PAPYR_7965 [Paratrimastix pyriformis]|uniref:Uncharacterized protein n=1 Tax=Paratrimastix pyriformis TaxID=342808 RepID=A0ABQ8UBT2_9EUKA|nr:hypothetical protein PAPYR_7965 [Paratrimastix pyriformis]
MEREKEEEKSRVDRFYALVKSCSFEDRLEKEFLRWLEANLQGFSDTFPSLALAMAEFMKYGCGPASVRLSCFVHEEFPPRVGSATLLPLLGEAENIEITEDLRTVGQLRALHRGRPIFLRDPVTRRRIHVQDSALLRPERIYFEDAPFEIHTFRVECAGIINYSAKHGGDFSLRETVTHAANTAAVPFLGEISHEPSPTEHACLDYYLVSVAIPCDDPGRLDQFMALVRGACSACDLSKCKHTTRPGTPDEYVTFSFPDHDFSRHKSMAASELTPSFRGSRH